MEYRKPLPLPMMFSVAGTAVTRMIWVSATFSASWELCSSWIAAAPGTSVPCSRMDNVRETGNEAFFSGATVTLKATP